MTDPFVPAYLRLPAGELQARAGRAAEMIRSCSLCARNCRADRRQHPERAACATGECAVVCSAAPHHGEERVISGTRGSGTIFFSHCNLACVFCQNWDISQQGEGRTVSADELADIMLRLQGGGCHNINLVSASHVIAPFLAALATAAEGGLQLPVVFNSGGYDSPDGLELLNGIVDIYMPDMKCSDPEVSGRYLGASDYPDVNRAAVREMHRQVGDLQVDARGLAQRGLLVRHLVLPDRLAGTDEICDFLADEISPATYINIMAQYRPCFRAGHHPAINRRPTAAELSDASLAARRSGLTRLDADFG